MRENTPPEISLPANTEVENAARPPMTVDEVGAAITDLMDNIARMPEDMVSAKRIAAAFGAHLDETNHLDIPDSVLHIEIVRAIGTLEMRILAIETGLKRAGIEIPDVITGIKDMN